MKILTASLAAFLSLALLSGPASADPVPRSLNTARNAARAVGWEVARRNQSVQSVKVASCQRKTSDRIHCLVLDRGSTSVLKTTCRVSVRVKTVNEVARGTLRGVSCRNERPPLLTAADALAAMQLRAQELSAGREALTDIRGRGSRTVLFGDAVWPPRGSIHDPQGELCAAQLRATLAGDGEIRISAETTDCTALPPDA